MVVVDREDLEDRLDTLEEAFGFGPTAVVAAIGTAGEYPEGVSREDISHTVHVDDPEDPIDSYEEVLVPYHRPPAFRGGVVVMSYEEIATVYATMPPDIRQRELEYRIESGEPIPPILQA